MTRMKKIISLFLASALLVLPLAATGGTEESAVTIICSAEPIEGLFFDFSTDISWVLRYDTPTIPVAFDILGLSKGDTATLSVSSTMAVSYPAQRTATAYSSKNRHVEMDISFTPDASKQLNTTKATVEEISLTVTSSDQTVPAQTLVLYVFPTPHGYFVSYVNEQTVREHYDRWRLENNIITQAQYKTIVKQRNIPKDLDEQAYLAAVTSKGGARTPQDTCIFADYTITVNGVNVTVTGSLYWEDRGGASHAAQDVRVDIMDEEDGNSYDEVLATTYTSDAGVLPDEHSLILRDWT